MLNSKTDFLNNAQKKRSRKTLPVVGCVKGPSGGTMGRAFPLDGTRVPPFSRGLAVPVPPHFSNRQPRHRRQASEWGAAMSRFWKPGSEKPSTLLVDDEEGGVIFLPSSTSSASSSGCGPKP